MHKLWSSDLSVSLYLALKICSLHTTDDMQEHLFVKHIIYLTSFQVVKSHPETTLGSHYHPFIGSRAQPAKEPDALGLHAGAEAGTSKGEWKHQPRDQPLCTSSLSWNKSFTLWIPPYLQKTIPMTIWGDWDLLQNSWGKSTEIKNKTNQDSIPSEAQWGVRTHVITLFFPFFSD